MIAEAQVERLVLDADDALVVEADESVKADPRRLGHLFGDAGEGRAGQVAHLGRPRQRVGAGALPHGHPDQEARAVPGPGGHGGGAEGGDVAAQEDAHPPDPEQGLVRQVPEERVVVEGPGAQGGDLVTGGPGQLQGTGGEERAVHAGDRIRPGPTRAAGHGPLSGNRHRRLRHDPLPFPSWTLRTSTKNVVS